MITFPNAKINLGLQVLRKRDDGFHDIETVLYPLPLFDSLEIILARGEAETTLNLYGIPIPEVNNLCLKAYQVLHDDFDLPPVKIHLLKGTPAGAGLGGGSSDASFTLMMINKLFMLGLTVSELEDYAAGLGSDCPFFIRNKPLLAKGRGEVLGDIDLSLAGKIIMIATPGLHISTAEAYSLVMPYKERPGIRELVGLPIEEWKNKLFNDFEEPVFERYPKLYEIKEYFYRMGAIYAAMSGSGSAIFGIFPEEFHLPGTGYPDPGTQLLLRRFQ